MNDLQNKMLEILEDTKNFYGEDPSRRSFDPKTGACLYFCDGKMCAVGRYLEDAENIQKEINEKSPNKYGSLGVGAFHVYLDNPKFKEGYENIPVEFWKHLQAFHDGRNHFTETGLSDLGSNVYENIKSYINEGVYY